MDGEAHDLDVGSPHPGAGAGPKGSDKSFPGDNSVVSPESPHGRRGSRPRCRLASSWGWSRSQGFGQPPMKEARELG